MPTKKFNPIYGYKLVDQLIEAGVVPPGSTKVIIEMDVQRMVEIHYSAFAEENLLGVLPMVLKEAVVGDATHDEDETPTE